MLSKYYLFQVKYSVYFKTIIKKMSFLKKESSSISFKEKFFIKHNCYLLEEKNKLNNRFCKQ